MFIKGYVIKGLQNNRSNEHDIEEIRRDILWRTHCCHYMGYSFQLAARGLYMHHPTDRITHTMAFVIPILEHWLVWEIAQWVHHEGSIWWPIIPWANTLTTELHLAPGHIEDYVYNNWSIQFNRRIFKS